MKIISVKPLENFSSWHEGCLWKPFGIAVGHFSFVMSCNFETELPSRPISTLVIYSRPLDQPQRVQKVDFCIDQLKQWVLDLSLFTSFDDFIAQLSDHLKSNHSMVENRFSRHGCHLTVIEEDWSEYAERVYVLYHNVAAKYLQIYNLEYICALAKQPNTTLICAWRGQELIGCSVLIAEPSTLHNTVFGLDYAHSKKSCTYSKLHYEFIRLAIEKGNFKFINAGLSADAAKQTCGFFPFPAVIECSARGRVLGKLLYLVQACLKFSIDEQNQVRVSVKWPWK